ncbi:dTDP-4-amino-4,6-dideoxygalactose transaminase [Vibrio sp. CK2-1]|uniref:dTDP-4-amino-4,6-dideoxygalactose transaminase n=1 Tax=Vibrio sp. CK2-1 TaxID=2912249 RepID=UPI001F01B84B|nr:dTDP-4-amino-4,6-dideoxygalactose transaminase [Vibrio sp. CK2-1]MCF7355395.1 dTDP-4-amino-4,6-dideoxygalactose transaminase [Vibrio sp. CK2-1]
MIPFNRPPYCGNEDKFVIEAMRSEKMCGDGKFTHLCQNWFERKFLCPKTLLTPSCTAALEMAAILVDIQPGDEVIMPSYTFVSTANAFVLRGAQIVFVDIRPDTMNINETLIEAAITSKTKAIVPVHYAGVACEMDYIMEIANRYNLFVIEDAAQGVMSTYKGKALGTIGHLGTFSFHETKNYTSAGEGGLLLINDSKFIKRAEIIREKGTNRSQFIQGIVDKYSWVDLGSSYLASDVQAAFLYGQLENAQTINNKRMLLWEKYYAELSELSKKGQIELPKIPNGCIHNAHMFYIKLNNSSERSKLIEHLKQENISSAFHYIPLHSSKAGMSFGQFNGSDIHTTTESKRLLRLPIFYSLTLEEQKKIIDKIISFFTGH